VEVSERLLIWGAGAIGGTIGAYLARASEDVTLVDTDTDHVATMRAHGLAIEGPIATFTQPVAVATPETLHGQFGRILLCVKAHHTEAAARQLAPHLAKGGYVASFQNGLNEYVIGRVVGLANVIGAFINFGADYLEPGRILYGGRGACVLGELDGTATPRLAALHATLTGFDPLAITTDNILGYLWGKLGYGVLLFATALTDDAIADVLDDSANQGVLTRVVGEVIAVAVAKRIAPEGFNGFDPVASGPHGTAEMIATSMAAMAAHNRRSAKSHSGIWRDLAIRKRRTEVDAQLGPVVETGAAVGVPTPCAARLIAMIHEIEDGARRLDRANLGVLSAAR
jgi:2-dehydropantoate 2-reductase